MRFLRQLSVCPALAAVLAASACTDGSVTPLRTQDGGVETMSSSGAGGSGGFPETQAGRRSLPPGPPFGGSGGTGDVFPACPGDTTGETLLVDALNNALARGDSCLRRRLAVRDDLRCEANSLAIMIATAPSPEDGGMQSSWVSMVLGWHVLPGGSGRAWWASLQAATAEDARAAMLSEDSTEICESAQRVPYKWVAVGHVFDSWVVELKADMP